MFYRIRISNGILRCMVPVCLLLPVLAGCSRSEPQGKVFGTVTFRGAPVPQGLVMFSNQEKGLFFTAELDPQGKFAVKTADGEGLPLGTYEVCVNPPVLDAPPIGTVMQPARIPEFANIPLKYRVAATSGLKLEVQEGDNPLNIQMQ